MKIFGIFVSLTFLAACSNSNFKGSVAASPPAAAASSGSNDAIPATQNTAPGTVSGSTVDQCSAAVAAGSLKVKQQTLSFPEHKGCDFGNNGNGPGVEGTLSAINTNTLQLDLPPGKICDIAIESDNNSQFKYDDMLVMTLDTNVLFFSTSYMVEGDLANKLDQKDGIYQWDFSKVRGLRPIDFGPRGSAGAAKCIGDSSECILPPSDTLGTVSIKLPVGKIIPISDSLVGKTKTTMSLIATGDDDGPGGGPHGNVNKLDCLQTALDVKITFKYLP
ncbi:MAG: hypothetical protein H7249_06085 [Chitinophagaceae bacterium]|nr:hypothetical protein [Oligoflexus sp.]